MYRFTILGTRGSLPVSGRQFLKYGGSTTCFTLETEQGLIIIDAGTGITTLNASLRARATPPPITVLFTHFHLDHLVGLPCFAPLYNDNFSMTFMGDPTRRKSWRKTLEDLMDSPYWPTNLSRYRAPECFVSLPMEAGTINLYGATISWCPVFHPQGCLAYKIQGGGKTIVVATDHEHSASDLSEGFAEFCQKTDYLIYDAMYTPDEYVSHTGWGHGNWEQGVQLAIEANAGELILTHHDFKRADDDIDRIVELSREFFPHTRAAADGMVLVE